MNVFDYIKNYCEANNISKYQLKSKVITKDMFEQQQTFAPGIAFFYKLNVTGEIQTVQNLSENLLTISTNTDFWDFSKIATISDNGTLQHAESDFVFVCEDMAKIELATGANAVFSQVYSAQLFYIYLTILERGSEPGNNSQSETPVHIEILK